MSSWVYEANTSVLGYPSLELSPTTKSGYLYLWYSGCCSLHCFILNVASVSLSFYFIHLKISCRCDQATSTVVLHLPSDSARLPS